MKKIIMVALATMFSLSALADDYTLYVQTAAAEYTYAFDNLQRITFSDGNMVIATKEGETAAVSISSIERVFFDKVATGIKSVENAEGVESAANREMYDLSGRPVSANAVLPKGIYVVKEGGKTFKIVKK